MLKNSIKRIILPVFLIIILSACLKMERKTGYTFDNKALDSIKVEESNKAEVRKKLGSPSMTSSYGGETWYYVSTDYEQIAFLSPTTKKQKVIAITFANDQSVTKIRQYDKHNAHNLTISDDQTPSDSDDLSITQQLLGNMGRFNKGKK